MPRRNFTARQKESALRMNQLWLKDHRVDGVEIALYHEAHRRTGKIYWCENCMFCHTSVQFFAVDHLVPDRMMRDWDASDRSTAPENMHVFCTSLQANDRGCNPSKGAKLYVPKFRGLAYSRAALDMNCYPIQQRPFPWTG